MQVLSSLLCCHKIILGVLIMEEVAMYLLRKQTSTQKFCSGLPIRRTANTEKFQADVYLQIKTINQNAKPNNLPPNV